MSALHFSEYLFLAFFFLISLACSFSWSYHSIFLISYLFFHLPLGVCVITYDCAEIVQFFFFFFNVLFIIFFIYQPLWLLFELSTHLFLETFFVWYPSHYTGQVSPYFRKPPCFPGFFTLPLHHLYWLTVTMDTSLWQIFTEVLYYSRGQGMVNGRDSALSSQGIWYTSLSLKSVFAIFTFHPK